LNLIWFILIILLSGASATLFRSLNWKLLHDNKFTKKSKSFVVEFNTIHFKFSFIILHNISWNSLIWLYSVIFFNMIHLNYIVLWHGFKLFKWGLFHDNKFTKKSKLFVEFNTIHLIFLHNLKSIYIPQNCSLAPPSLKISSWQ